MITELPREQLVTFGIRLRAAYLIEQAGYTLGIAALDGQPLADLLLPGFFDETRQVLGYVTTAHQDRTLTEEEAKATRDQHGEAFADAKVLRRKVSRRAALASRLGRAIPDTLLKISSVRSPQAMAIQLSNMAAILEANPTLLVGTGIPELIARARELAAQLQSADAAREVKRLAELPEAVTTFYLQKGTLYVALKAINDAGQALHAEDTAKSSRYNLSILYRRGGGSPPAAQDQPPAP